MIPDAAFIVGGVSAGGQILHANSRATRMFGYTRDELIGRPIEILVPQYLSIEHVRHRHAFAQAPTLRTMAVDCECRGRRRDGTEFPIDVLLDPGDGSAGSATIAVVRDATTAHAVHAVHERQLQALIDNVPIVVAYIDKDERLRYANNAFRELIPFQGDPRGVAAKTVMGESLYGASNDIRQRAMAGERVSMVMPVTMHGQQRIREVTYIPDRDTTGSVQGVYELGYDITEREQLSTELRHSEERARALFMQATEGIFIADRDGRCTDVNRAGCELLGRTHEELVGQTFADLIPPGDLGQLSLAMTQLLAGNAIFGVWRLRHKDGHFVPVELSGGLLSDGRLLSFVRDITRRELLEDALTEARDSAIKANEVKSRFLAAASHDLRQPLQTIWSLQTVLARALQNTEYEPQCALLEEAVRSMDHILASLIDINRLEKGAIHPVIRDFPLEEILPRLRSEFGYAANSKSLALDIQQSPDFARSDPMLLPVILRNLIGNAIKYTQRGSVRVRVRAEETQLFIDIIDSGPGIPAEHLERLFEAFYQIENPHRDQRRGVGLGLSIVQTICRLLDHTVSIESKVGHGSTFTIQLPRGVATALPNERVSVSVPIPPPAAGKRKVLHIEDDPGVARSMAMLLRLEGYEVIGASTRDEALQHVQVQGVRPDLILCDFNLPIGFTGDEVVAEIAIALGLKPPTIMLTGDIADRHLEKAKLVAERILPKPVNIGTLLDGMRALLEQRAVGGEICADAGHVILKDSLGARCDPLFAELLTPSHLAMLEGHSHSVYGVWSDLALAYVNPAWFTFARRNAGEHADPRSWGIGRSTLDAIPACLRAWYGALFCAASAADGGHPRQFEYECSTAEVHRRFVLQVFPLAGALRGGYIVVHSLRFEVPHVVSDRVAMLPDMQAYADAAGFLHQCVNCRRVQSTPEPSNWCWVPEWVREAQSNVEHALCPKCLRAFYPEPMQETADS
jgi:PAS domain S-box-containing protein